MWMMEKLRKIGVVCAELRGWGCKWIAALANTHPCLFLGLELKVLFDDTIGLWSSLLTHSPCSSPNSPPLSAIPLPLQC